MLTVAIIAASVSLLVGAGGGFFLGHRTSKNDVAVAEVPVHVIEATTAPEIAKTEIVAEVTSTDRARWLCEGERASETACVAYLLCAQGVEGGAVQPSACDAAVNQWVSERQLQVIESDSANPALREERRNSFRARK
jgi:hypothetical protein